MLRRGPVVEGRMVSSAVGRNLVLVFMEDSLCLLEGLFLSPKGRGGALLQVLTLPSQSSLLQALFHRDVGFVEGRIISS